MKKLKAIISKEISKNVSEGHQNYDDPIKYDDIYENIEISEEIKYALYEGMSPETEASVSDKQKMFNERLDSTYGKSKDSDVHLTGDALSHSLHNHFHEHYSLNKDEQIRRVHGAAHRLAKSLGIDVKRDPSKTQDQHNEAVRKKVVSTIFSANKKVQTLSGIVDRHGRKVNSELGMKGSPATYEYHHGSKKSTLVTCPKFTADCAGKVGKRDGSCLAMKGPYQFATNISGQISHSHLQHDPREDEHGNSPHKDYALLSVHHIINEAKKAKSKNTSVGLRTQVTDEAPAKSAYRSVLRKIKIGEIKTDHETHDAALNHLNIYDYNKDHHNSVHEPDIGIHTIASDTGSIAKDGKQVAGNLGREKALKAAMTERKSKDGKIEKHPQNSYTVIGGSTHLDGEEVPFKHMRSAPEGNQSRSDKIAKVRKHNESLLSNIKTVRRYDTHIEDHKDGEPETFHHPDGWGHVTTTHNGKKVKVGYQDHHVPMTVMKDGKVSYSSSHDARFDPREYKDNNKDKHGNRVGNAIVAMPTSSTSEEEVKHGGMFHDIKHLTHESPDKHGRTGVLHINHPNEMNKAKFQYSKNEKLDVKNI